MKKNKSHLLKIYRSLIQIRITEKKIAEKYQDQKMRCPVHLSIGQESVPVAVCENLNNKDQVVTAHRSHAHYIAKGGSIKSMICELHGKKNGCAMGLGGSMHLIDINAGVTAAVPIVGSTLPIGVGKAWANKLKKNNQIVVIFFGDGATEEGVFLESLDFASLHDLRVLFVCENNNFSVYSPIKNRQHKKRSITKIAKSIGIESKKFKHHDVLKLDIFFQKTVNMIRKNARPYLVEIDTWRCLEHCGPNYDDYLNYRNKSLIKKWKLSDQIIKLGNFLINKNYIKEKEILNLKKKIEKDIDKIFIIAEKSDYPKKKILQKFIYA